jgi:hypothetical protein
MFRDVQRTLGQFRHMPTGLRWIAIAVSSLSLCMLAVVPIDHLRKDGFELSYVDARTKGVGPLLHRSLFGARRLRNLSRQELVSPPRHHPLVVVAQHAGHDQWTYRILVPLILTLIFIARGMSGLTLLAKSSPLNQWRPGPCSGDLNAASFQSYKMVPCGITPFLGINKIPSRMK